MSNALYPLCFRPVYKDYIWGGSWIRMKFARDGVPEICAESWELSGRPEGMSVISNGHLAGRSLQEIAAAHGHDLYGKRCAPGGFPLLVKILDAKQKLSVQVHPGAGTRLPTGAEPKSELWYVLDAKEGSSVFAGLRPGTGKPDFLSAIEKGKVESVLRRVPVQTGDAVYVPGGRVHAVGAGCLLLEVQQSSNTTYRVFDWNRTGTDGKPRQLHSKEALESMAWNDFTDPKLVVSPLPSSTANRRERVIQTDLFDIERIALTTAEEGIGKGASFEILFMVSGNARVENATDGPTEVRAGSACLVPAAVQPYRLQPATSGTIVIRIIPGTL